jgi:phosphoribosylformylglycinamidine (FGAM) synthase-like enzyme
MTAYEMMLSESQERMLMVLRPEKEAEARAVFEKWDLDFAIVGETIAEDRFVIVHGNETVKADLPLSRAVLRGAGIRPALGREPPCPRRWSRRAGGRSRRRARALIASPNYCLAGLDLRAVRLQVMADTSARPAAARASCGCTAPTRRWPSPPT